MRDKVVSKIQKYFHIQKTFCRNRAGFGEADTRKHSTRKTAFQLHCAATKFVFIISTCIIAEYSALLEPVANILQSKNLDLLQCTNHIKKILSVVKTHRETADVIIKDLLISAQDIAMKILVEIQLPRVIERQQNRSNPPATSPDEYWKQSILIPYLDSFTSALENRFSEDNVLAFSILFLHPFLMLDLTIENLKFNRGRDVLLNFTIWTGLKLKLNYGIMCGTKKNLIARR